MASPHPDLGAPKIPTQPRGTWLQKHANTIGNGFKRIDGSPLKTQNEQLFCRTKHSSINTVRNSVSFTNEQSRALRITK